MGQQVLANKQVFVGYWAKDLNGANVTGLTISSFTVSLTDNEADASTFAAAGESVTLTELDATNLPGQYEFRFTPTSEAKYVLSVTPTYTDNIGDAFRVEFDVQNSLDASSNDLCTRAEVKAYLGGYGSDTADDSLIDNTIDRVTKFVQNYTGATLFQSTFTEYYNGGRNPSIVLREQPVSSITTVHEDTAAPRVYDSSTLLTADEDYLLDDHGILWREGARWAKSPKSVKVVYVAGYSTVPPDLNWVGVRLSALWLRSREFVGIESQSLGDGSVVHFGNDRLPHDVKQILDLYMVHGAGAVI